MASTTVNQPVLTERRQDVIRQAACESLHWINLIRDQHQQDGFDTIAPTMFRRLEQLSSVVLAAVDEKEWSVETEVLEAAINDGTPTP